MTTSCARCGSDNEDGARFCGVCGARIDAPEPQPTPSTMPIVVAPPLLPAPATQTAVLLPRGVFDPSDPSMRVPIARGASALAIILVLLLDAGLATAGVLLMRAGLGAAGGAGVASGSGSAEISDAGAASGSGVASAARSGEATTPPPRGSSGGGGGGTRASGEHGGASSSGAGGGVAAQPAPGSGSAAGSGTNAGSGANAGSGSTGTVVNGMVSDLFGHSPDAATATTPPPPSPTDAAVSTQTTQTTVTTPAVDAAPATPPPSDAAGGPVDPYNGTPDAADSAPPPTAATDAAPAGSGSASGSGGSGSASDDDPHTADLADQVARKTEQSQPRFHRCYEESAKAYTPDQPLTGEVDIAFRVMPTGEVQNTEAVKNTTGSDKLADCLVAVIGAWKLAPSDLSEPAVFVRPLHFDGH